MKNSSTSEITASQPALRCGFGLSPWEPAMPTPRNIVNEMAPLMDMDAMPRIPMPQERDGQMFIVKLNPVSA